MKNYRKTRTSLKKTKFLSIWTAVFVFAASLVLIGCPNQAGSSVGGSYQKTKITINYNSYELTVEKWDASAKKWEELPPNTPVDEDTHLFFKAKNLPSGKMVDKWILNGKEKTPRRNNDLLYKLKAEDAVEQAGKKVIEVTYSLKDAASITIKYNSGEITVKKKDTASGNWMEISSDTEVDEGSDLLFRVKNIPPGKMLDKWLLNGKKEVKPNYLYSVSVEDSVEEGGKKVIKIARILKDAASITIKYNSGEITVKKKDTASGNWMEISSDTEVDEGSDLLFEAKNIPPGKMLDKWLLNGKKEVKPNYIYSVRVEDAVEEAGKKVIKVERILKDAASITIKYNSDEIIVRNIMLGGGLPVEVPSGTTVYEGSLLSFNTKDGHSVTKWILNGKKEVEAHVAYQVDSKDAVDEGDKKVIRVTFE